VNLREQLRKAESAVRRLRKAVRAENRLQRGLGPKRVGRGSRDRDEELKKQRGYSDPSSFVRHDGSEVLKGEDWCKRKEELKQRSLGICEMYRILHKPHVGGCEVAATEPHHVIRRSIRRDDRLERLAHLSHACHDSLDPRKVRWTKQSEKQ
jgi:hypothetical protein